MTYTVSILPAALKDMRKLPRTALKKVDRAILALAHDPRPSGVKALQGDMAGLHRIRVADYRIVYLIKDREVLVCIVRVRHRKEVYR